MLGKVHVPVMKKIAKFELYHSRLPFMALKWNTTVLESLKRIQNRVLSDLVDKIVITRCCIQIF